MKKICKKKSKAVYKELKQDKIIPLQKRTPEENKKFLLQVAQSQFHQGPLPVPEDLYKYEKICPGAADRIIRMAEEEQKSLNKYRLKEYRSLRMGLIFGFVSLLCLMLLTGLALYWDKPWVAGVLIAVVSTCTVLVSRKKKSD